MKTRRICTRIDSLDSNQKKELRTRINDTVKEFNEEQSQNEDESE